MDRLYGILKTATWAFIGVFAGRSIARWIDYRTRPGLYALASAPWYQSILIHAAVTAAIVAALLTAMHILRKRNNGKD